MAATVVRLQNASTTAQSAAAEAAWQPEPMPEDDDLVLIRRVAAKDRQAFEVLYHRYARRLYGYVAKFLKQPELVEEVFDDVMLVVWQNAARFDHSSRLSTWIFGIAHHKALKALGRSSRQPTEPLPDVPLGSEDPEGIVARRELGRTITQALDALSPEQRAVVELTFYHGCSYQEIATITGCPVNTVKTRMFHARRRLQQFLRGWGMRRASEEGEESA
ncbi:MAG TPA: sigma-70 family RNA polymerase sigma factor [Alphaproteobacteria bacterium]|nr:sigma-70 family RNA polymerase sigma factor [Alphaproteobacteria bacterium]